MTTNAGQGNGEGQQNNNPPAPNSGGGGKTYTEAEFAAVLAERDDFKNKHEASSKKVSDFEKEKLTETERLQKERDDAAKERDDYKTQLTTIKVHGLFASLAREAGATYPDQLHRFANESELELDGKGELKNGEAAIKRIKKEYPALFGPGGSGDGKGGQGQQANTGGMNSMIRQAAGR